MKSVLLAVFSLLFASQLFASNKICIGEKVIVVLNDNVNKLTVHDKETMEVLQSTSLEGSIFGELALSQDGSKIWFQMDATMYCRDVSTGEIVKELEGANAYTFELSAAQDYLVHFENMEDHALIYVYDLNTAEAISNAKVDFTQFLETIHYDHKKQVLHLLSQTFDSKTEKSSEEPMYGIVESSEEITESMLYDERESRYYVYDIANKKVIYDQNLSYSPDFSSDFEVINDRLTIVTQVGTAQVQDDYSLKVASLAIPNLADYAIDGSNLIGMNGFFLFFYSFEDDSIIQLYDDEVNQILIEADAISITDTDYYTFKEGVFYRFKRSDPMNADFDMPMD